MRVQGAAVCLMTVMLLGGCSPQPPRPPTANLTLGTPAPATTAGPEATGAAEPEDPAPIDTGALLGAGEQLTVPADPAGAAAYLAARVRDPATARTATREILLRSGIGIFGAETGALAAVPADPAFVDASIYEFQVPLLADGVAGGASVTLQPALDLLQALGWVSDAGTLVQLEDAVRAWLDASAADPAAPLAFGGLAVRELMRAAGTDPAGPVRLDPLAFQVFLASLVSDLGHFGGMASAPGSAPQAAVLTAMRSAPAAGEAGAAAGDECDEPAKAYDSGLYDKLYKTIVQKSASILFGPAWTKAGSRVYDYGKILSTVQALGSPGRRTKLTVTSEAGGTPHYRHSTGDGGGSNVWYFTAKVEFNTSLAGRIVNCGALAGLRIPANGGIEGLRLQRRSATTSSAPSAAATATSWPHPEWRRRRDHRLHGTVEAAG